MGGLGGLRVRVGGEGVAGGRASSWGFGEVGYVGRWDFPMVWGLRYVIVDDVD